MKNTIRRGSSSFGISEVHLLAGGAERRSLNVALFGLDEERRRMMAEAMMARQGVRVRGFSELPAASNVESLAQQYNAIVFDADFDSGRLLGLIEQLSVDGNAYVMAYSVRADMKLAVRFMRAGVREFFTLPFDSAEVAAALSRASQHHVSSGPEKAPGKLASFLGTKGGCGVTTLAANFALALAMESEQKALLIDLGLPLGDVAINLGMKTQYSVVNALQDTDRLDPSFLSSLIAKHSTGLEVLPAPNEFLSVNHAQESLDKLIAVARQSYDYVVVDAGSRVDLMGTAVFEQASIIYLVTQVGISELRNAHRMITQFFGARGPSLQIVLNRYTQRALLFDDAQITKTLTRPADLRIPDDYGAARRTRNASTPMVMMDSPIAEIIRDMARTAAGITAEPAEKESKRSGMGIFRLLS
jgi:pilus assembly protein CpaE